MVFTAQLSNVLETKADDKTCCCTLALDLPVVAAAAARAVGRPCCANNRSWSRPVGRVNFPKERDGSKRMLSAGCLERSSQRTTQHLYLGGWRLEQPKRRWSNSEERRPPSNKNEVNPSISLLTLFSPVFCGNTNTAHISLTPRATHRINESKPPAAKPSET